MRLAPGPPPAGKPARQAANGMTAAAWR